MQKIKLPKIINPIYSTNLQIRIYDINYGNHLSNDSLVSLLHESRIQFLKHFGFSELNINGVGILVTSLFVNYKAQAFYGDNIDIFIGIGEISKTRIDICYDLKSTISQKDIAQAITTITFFDYTKSKITSIPQAFLNIVTPYQDPSFF